MNYPIFEVFEVLIALRCRSIYVYWIFTWCTVSFLYCGCIVPGVRFHCCTVGGAVPGVLFHFCTVGVLYLVYGSIAVLWVVLYLLYGLLLYCGCIVPGVRFHCCTLDVLYLVYGFIAAVWVVLYLLYGLLLYCGWCCTWCTVSLLYWGCIVPGIWFHCCTLDGAVPGVRFHFCTVGVLYLVYGSIAVLWVVLYLVYGFISHFCTVDVLYLVYSFISVL